MLLSKCEVCDSKSKFAKKQQAGGLLSSSGIKTPLSKTLSRSSFVLELLTS